MDVKRAKLTPISLMVGEDEEDTGLLRENYRAAETYIRSFKWCKDIKDSFFGIGVGGVVAVFLFRIDALEGVDEWLWVIDGDLPSAYLVMDQAPEPIAALKVYCQLMDVWIDAVRHHSDLNNVFPVWAAPTAENADLLESRIAFLRREVIPALS